MSGPRYLALVGAPRAGAAAGGRGRLDEALESLNLELAGAIASRFVVDESGGFRALFHRPGAAVDACIGIEDEARELGIAYGLGWGEVTGALRVVARDLEGPCLAAARDALRRARARGRRFGCRGWGVRRDRALEGLFGLLAAVRDGWTPRQAEIVARVRCASTQREAAALLGVSPSVVSEALAAADYRAVLGAEEAARQLLESFAEG